MQNPKYLIANTPYLLPYPDLIIALASLTLLYNVTPVLE